MYLFSDFRIETPNKDLTIFLDYLHLKCYHEIHPCVYDRGLFSTDNWEDTSLQESSQNNRREYSKQILEFLISTPKKSKYSLFFLLAEQYEENSEDYQTKPTTRGFAYNNTPINQTKTTRLSREHEMELEDLAPVRTKRDKVPDGPAKKKTKKTNQPTSKFDPSDPELSGDDEEEEEEACLEVKKKPKFVKKKQTLLDRLDQWSMLKWSFSTLAPITKEELW